MSRNTDMRSPARRALVRVIVPAEDGQHCADPSEDHVASLTEFLSPAAAAAATVNALVTCFVEKSSLAAALPEHPACLNA